MYYFCSLANSYVSFLGLRPCYYNRFQKSKLATYTNTMDKSFEIKRGEGRKLVVIFPFSIALLYFVRNIEDSWFGSWKYLLLGEWLDHKNLDLAHKKLVHDLKSKCKLDVNEGILKVFLGGSKNDCEGDTWISQLCVKKGCYIAKVGYCDEAWRGITSNAGNGLGSSSELAFKILNEASIMLEEEKRREPIILVLDYDIQV